MKLLFEVFDSLPKSVPGQQLSALLKGQEVSAHWRLRMRSAVFISDFPPVSCFRTS